MHVSRKGAKLIGVCVIGQNDICSLIEDSENYIDFMSEQIICIMMLGHIATLASQYLPFSQSDEEPLRRLFVTE